MFCPRCGGPSAWVHDTGPASGGDAVDATLSALARTVCARCAPALGAWFADAHEPAGFVDVALAAPWRVALDRFDHPALSASLDDGEVRARGTRDLVGAGQAR